MTLAVSRVSVEHCPVCYEIGCSLDAHGMHIDDEQRYPAWMERDPLTGVTP